MSEPPTPTPEQLAALACQDCPASVHTSRGQGVGGPVLVVIVQHEPTCPWLARYAPNGSTTAVPNGLLQHTTK